MEERMLESHEKVPVEIGIDDADRQKIAEGLSRFLADTYTLYLKTQNYHWNVTGSMFRTLHIMFEEQYMDLRDAADLVAERIRQLGFFAPATFKSFQKLTTIEEDEEREIPHAKEMVRNLIAGHQTCVQTVRSLFPVIHNANDESTLNLLTDRLNVHEKTAWMLRSMLD